MTKATWWATALILQVALAFEDTSPLFLFATSEILLPSSPGIITAAQAQDLISSSTCLSNDYVVISQPSARASDFANEQLVPRLRDAMGGRDERVRSSFSVSNVLGRLSLEEIGRKIEVDCGAVVHSLDGSSAPFLSQDVNATQSRVLLLSLTSLPGGYEGQEQLKKNDDVLASVLEQLSSRQYTVIYTTTPRPTVTKSWINPSSDTSDFDSDSDSAVSYQMDSDNIHTFPHIDLKRDLSSHDARRASDDEDKSTLPNGPLFERYSFLSPGIFMGALVIIMLLSVLYVGISAIAGLEATYAAFDKEMGPTAQKKVQ